MGWTTMNCYLLGIISRKIKMIEFNFNISIQLHSKKLPWIYSIKQLSLVSLHLPSLSSLQWIIIWMFWEQNQFLFVPDYGFSLLFSVVPPSIGVDLQMPENISIVEKNPISLVCEASGIPLPSITWLKNGWPVTLNNSVRILSGTKVVVI